MPHITISNFHVTITLITLLAAIISFIREKTPVHVTALVVMAVLLLSGVINTREMLSVFSNSAPITIAAMFVISAALKSTGIIDHMGYYIIRAAERNYVVALICFYGFVLLASSFMNNTPIVIVMTPVIIIMAKKLNKYPSKFLIPLSYVAIMGGTCTLIGTSTNLLVNGIVISSKMPSFNIFDITAPGLIMALVGVIFLSTIGYRLLPERSLISTEMLEPENNNSKHFMATAMVLADSEFINKTLNELGFPQSKDCLIIDIIRKDVNLSESLSNSKLDTISKNKKELDENKINALLRQISLQPFDRLVIRSNKEQLLAISKLSGISVGEHPALSELREAKDTIIMEGIIGPRSRLINEKINSSWIRRVYDCHIWALHRRGRIIKENFSKIPLQFGDVLLIEGTPKGLEELFKNEEILSLTRIPKPAANKKSIIALLTIIGVVALAALNFMPIAGLAIIGAVFVVVTKCVSSRVAYETIDWRILMLIFGMLTLSIAMQKTGIAQFIIQQTAEFSKGFGPQGVLASIYIVTSLLTEFMTNTAAAVLITPLVIGLTLKLGLDPRPFIVAIMFAASASFATPLGYQTNTYVYNAGNYKFRDFLKIGIPMNILNFVTAIFVIPLFWPLR